MALQARLIYRAYCTAALFMMQQAYDPGRAPPCDVLPIRSAGAARAAGDPVAPRAAQPDGGEQLFAPDPARESFRQLAAGSARQLAGADQLPGKGAGV